MSPPLIAAVTLFIIAIVALIKLDAETKCVDSYVQLSPAFRECREDQHSSIVVDNDGPPILFCECVDKEGP